MAADGRGLADAVIDFRAFARGEPIPVEVGAIERELGALWQQAGRRRGLGRLARRALERRDAGPRARGAGRRPSSWSTRWPPGCRRGRSRCCLEDARHGRRCRRRSRATSSPSPAGARRLLRGDHVGRPGPTPRPHFGALVRGAADPRRADCALFWIDPTLPVAADQGAPAGRRPVDRRHHRLRAARSSCSRCSSWRAGPAPADRRSRLAAPRQRALAVRGAVRSADRRARRWPPPRASSCATAPVRRQRAAARRLAGGPARLAAAARAAQTSDGGLRFDFQRGDAPGAGDRRPDGSRPRDLAARAVSWRIELYAGSDRYGRVADRDGQGRRRGADRAGHGWSSSTPTPTLSCASSPRPPRPRPALRPRPRVRRPALGPRAPAAGSTRVARYSLRARERLPKMIVLQGNWKSIVSTSGFFQLVHAVPTSSSCGWRVHAASRWCRSVTSGTSVPATFTCALPSCI